MWFLVPLQKVLNYCCYACSLQVSDQRPKYYCYMWHWSCSGITFQPWYVRSVYMVWLVISYFPLYNPLPHSWNIASHLLLYHYFDGKYSNEQHSLVSPVQSFAAKTHHSTDTRINYQHSLCIPLIREFTLGWLLPKNDYFMEETP